MFKFLIAAILGLSVLANADEVVNVPIQAGAESAVLFNFIKSPKSGSVDENGFSIVNRMYLTSDEAVRIKCSQNTISLDSSCSATFRLNSPLNVATQVSVAPTNAIVAILNDSDSYKLNSYLSQPKRYSTQEKISVEFNGKTFLAPRLTIDCSSSSPSALTCKIIAFHDHPFVLSGCTDR